MSEHTSSCPVEHETATSPEHNGAIWVTGYCSHGIVVSHNLDWII